MQRICLIISFILQTCICQGLEYKYEVSMMGIFRDEADHLEEWIEYHRMIGVEHFLLFNHVSEDHFIEVLEKYIKNDIVTLVDWNDPTWPKAQLDAYKEGIKMMKGETKWLCVFDIDEFLVLKQHDTVKEFLKEFEDAAGVCIHWQLFGTSNIKSLPPYEPLTKHLIYRAKEQYKKTDWIDNRSVKSIIRPDRINENSKNPNHGCHIFDPIYLYENVNENNKLLGLHTRQEHISVKKSQLNHYWFRTEDWFWKNKVERRACQNEKYDTEKAHRLMDECNQVLDLQLYESFH